MVKKHTKYKLTIVFYIGMKKRGNAALNKHLKVGFEDHELREDSTKDAHYFKTFLQESTSRRVIFLFNLN